jgi:terminase small subunit-like protein
VGRPTEFSPTVAARICEEIESGDSLVKVCSAEGMPNRSTVYDWLARQEPEFKAFADRYARAVESRAEKLAEEIISIADDDEGDYGYKEGADKDGEGAKLCILPDNIQRAKLRVDSRKWVASKLFPKKYGDFQRIEAQVSVSIADRLKEARERAKHR